MSTLTAPSTCANQLIDGAGIAKLAGRTDPYFAHTLQRRNATFPRAVTGGSGKGKAFWLRSQVEAWLACWRNREAGEMATSRLRDQTVSTLDNAMARQIICRGWRRGGKAISQQNNKTTIKH